MASHVGAGPAVCLEDGLQVLPAPRERLQGALDRPDDAAERDLAGQEGVHRLLVGRVQDRRAPPAGVGRASGQPDGRKAGLVERVELERPQVLEVGRRHSVAKPVGIAEGDRDRKAHVGAPELRLQGAVHELDQRVNRALRVDDHRDVLKGHAEQMVGLDELQTLVHHGRRVDGHLWAHRPARVVQRLLDGDLVEVKVGMSPERAAARGDDQPANAIQTLSPQALPDGAVLGVDGPDAAGAGSLHHQRARHHEDLFGRKRDFLLRFQRGHRRSQRPRSRDRDHHDVASRVGDHRDDARVEVGLTRLALDDVFGVPACGAPALREPGQSQPFGIAIDDVQRLLADGAGSAEDRDVEGSAHQWMSWNMDK